MTELSLPATDFPDLTAFTEEQHYAYASQVREVEYAIQWEYGRIAASLDTKYGEGTLEKLAKVLGKSYSTIVGYKNTWTRWANLSPEIDLPNWSVAKALASQPDRHELVEANPGMSKREAHAIVTERNGGPRSRPVPAEPKPDVPGSPEDKLTQLFIKQTAQSIARFAGTSDYGECVALLEALQPALTRLEARIRAKQPK